MSSSGTSSEPLQTSTPGTFLARSRSTAFFRMMIERGDFTAVHEPFSYLAELGYAALAGTRITSAPALLSGLRQLAARRPVFVKETTGGFESLFEVFTEAARLTGHDPVVIDAADLMATPAAIVEAYCERVGIAFLPQALM